MSKTYIETIAVYHDGLNDENRRRLKYSTNYTTQVVPSLNALVATLTTQCNQTLFSLKLYPYPGYTVWSYGEFEKGINQDAPIGEELLKIFKDNNDEPSESVTRDKCAVLLAEYRKF